MFPTTDTQTMPKSQMLLLSAFTGSFVAIAATGGSAMVYVQNLLTHLPI